MPRLPAIAAAAAAMFMAACDSSEQAMGVEMIEVPVQWAATDLHVMQVEWHVIPPDMLPVVCGDTESVGCTVYGNGWADNGRCAIAAADPRHWSETSEVGLRRHRTLAHEVMHCAFGSFHD